MAKFSLVLLAAVSLIFFAHENSLAQQVEPNPYSLNDFGGIGLFQTRTARFSNDGQFHLGLSLANPYRRYFLTWQILPFAEVTFRYTDATNFLRTSQVIEQSQETFFKDTFLFRKGPGNFDRSFDVKFRLKKESDFWPEIAIGLQDLIGTGRFSGEYIVASKRFDALDFTLGLGWGTLGSRGGLPNPFKVFGSRFDSRTGGAITGGTFPIGRYFSGDRISLFGGVEYSSPIDGLTFKFEFGGTDPDKVKVEALIGESFPINAGFNYRPVKWWEMSMAWERGNSLMLRSTFRANFYDFGVPKPSVRQPIVRPRPEGFEPTEFEISYVGPAKNEARAELDTIYQDIQELGFRVDAFQTELLQAQVTLSRTNDNRALQNSILPALFDILFDALPEAVQLMRLSITPANDTLNGAHFEMSREGHQALSELNTLDTETSSDLVVVTEITVEENTLTLLIANEDTPGSDQLRMTAIRYFRSVTKIQTISIGHEGTNLLVANGNSLISDQIVEETFAAFDTSARHISGLTIIGDNLEIQTHLITQEDPLILPINALELIAAATHITNVWVDPYYGDEPEELSPLELTNAVFNAPAPEN